MRRWRTPLVVAAVAVAHVGVFALIAHVRATPPQALPEVFEVFLFRPPASPPPPPPPPEPAREIGGGAPAAPSRTHRPPDPRPVAPELAAPPEPAPEQPLVVGASPVTGPAPGQGQGGEGTGTGGGSGAGTGPGSGTVRFRLISAPTDAQIARLHPGGSGRRDPGEARVSCRIRLDTRLEACRVVSESPPGQGFGQAAINAAALYRFQPPSRDGRPQEGETTLVITFGRGRR